METALVNSDQLPRRPAGRPRSFDDADVFAATNRALVREGYANLTLAAIARELGITGPALNRRYGDKHTLIESYIGWLTEQMTVRLKEAHAQYPDSPLNVLRARWYIPVPGDPTPEAERPDPTHTYEFFIGAWNDPVYRPLLAELVRQYEHGVVTVLTEAHAAGEIVATDFERLGHALNAAVIGSIVLRGDRAQGTIERSMGQVFDAVLDPYLAKTEHRVA